jgi:putative membrane protein
VIPFPILRLIAYAIAAIVATLSLATVAPQFLDFEDAESVLLFGVVIGIINSFLKPVIQTLTLPISCLTLGLFSAVVNIALFYVGASVTPGMDVNWWGAIFGSLITSVASGLIFAVVDE